MRTVASSQVIAGEKIDLLVTSEVRMGDVVVIAKGCPAEAVVTVAQAKRTMARLETGSKLPDEMLFLRA